MCAGSHLRSGRREHPHPDGYELLSRLPTALSRVMTLTTSVPKTANSSSYLHTIISTNRGVQSPRVRLRCGTRCFTCALERDYPKF